jgi:hypothetical protein
VCQAQPVNDSYGLCTIGHKNNCEQTVLFFHNHDRKDIYDPDQKKYSNDDNCSSFIASLFCCRVKCLFSFNDSLVVDCGCLTNGTGCDCSQADGYGCCEFFCLNHRTSTSTI